MNLGQAGLVDLIDAAAPSTGDQSLSAGSKTSKKRKGIGRLQGSQGYNKNDVTAILDLVDEYKPTGDAEWDMIVRGYNHYAYSSGRQQRDRKCLRKKFFGLVNALGSTKSGDVGATNNNDDEKAVARAKELFLNMETLKLLEQPGRPSSISASAFPRAKFVRGGLRSLLGSMCSQQETLLRQQREASAQVMQQFAQQMSNMQHQHRTFLTAIYTSTMQLLKGSGFPPWNSVDLTAGTFLDMGTVLHRMRTAALAMPIEEWALTRQGTAFPIAILLPWLQTTFGRPLHTVRDLLEAVRRTPLRDSQDPWLVRLRAVLSSFEPEESETNSQENTVLPLLPFPLHPCQGIQPLSGVQVAMPGPLLLEGIGLDARMLFMLPDLSQSCRGPLGALMEGSDTCPGPAVSGPGAGATHLADERGGEGWNSPAGELFDTGSPGPGSRHRTSSRCSTPDNSLGSSSGHGPGDRQSESPVTPVTPPITYEVYPESEHGENLRDSSTPFLARTFGEVGTLEFPNSNVHHCDGAYNEGMESCPEALYLNACNYEESV